MRARHARQSVCVSDMGHNDRVYAGSDSRKHASPISRNRTRKQYKLEIRVTDAADENKNQAGFVLNPSKTHLTPGTSPAGNHIRVLEIRTPRHNGKDAILLERLSRWKHVKSCLAKSRRPRFAGRRMDKCSSCVLISLRCIWKGRDATGARRNFLGMSQALELESDDHLSGTWPNIAC